MCKLTENQAKVLELFYRGLKKSDIQRTTGLSSSSVDEALKRGKMNITKAIETVSIVVKRGWVSNSQIAKLKQICQKTNKV